MTSQSSPGGAAGSTTLLFTPKEQAAGLKVSVSFLAKARMRGDGPPYIKVGRSVRYTETGQAQYLASRQRRSTSDK